MAEKRLMVSCYRGLAPVSVPAEWVQGMDIKHGFAAENGRAQIYFKGINRAFEVWVEQDGPDVRQCWRELTPEEIAEIQWGPICSPWEPNSVAQLFGHGRPIRLGEEE